MPGKVLALWAAGAPAPVRALVYGVASVGAAFLLSWATEAVQAAGADRDPYREHDRG